MPNEAPSAVEVLLHFAGSCLSKVDLGWLGNATPSQLLNADQDRWKDAAARAHRAAGAAEALAKQLTEYPTGALLVSLGDPVAKFGLGRTQNLARELETSADALSFHITLAFTRRGVDRTETIRDVLARRLQLANIREAMIDCLSTLSPSTMEAMETSRPEVAAALQARTYDRGFERVEAFFADVTI